MLQLTAVRPTRGKPSYEALSAKAYHAKLNAEGVAMPSSDWNDEGE
ncbi:hypothetical protein HMPREF0762_01567 [Slackia exigua ATCC 700122]|uniref:Uncharacterized protein n=1 Tax=Slackia exigua (strain ATCC 700122 / DSM 15923 / CIP 105133 / JCM 11022 / KCTC 5966 / S-7) TaxID=649764 RepID=D0WI95_SLAES|nr:hypothetical protein HMPREF0762_01567 [Slackia exigua ATCC 700122]